jgi:hypothetical protein
MTQDISGCFMKLTHIAMQLAQQGHIKMVYHVLIVILNAQNALEALQLAQNV